GRSRRIMAFRKKSATPPPPPPPPRTLFEKIWDAHVVNRQDDGTCVIYVDRHLVHEVTSPQAFEGLRMAGRPVRPPECTTAVGAPPPPVSVHPPPGHGVPQPAGLRRPAHGRPAGAPARCHHRRGRPQHADH